MAERIEIISKVPDARASVTKDKLVRNGFPVSDVQLADVYTLQTSLSREELQKVASMLTNPVTQEASISKPTTPKDFDWAVEVGFLPGVKDRVAETLEESLEDALKAQLPANEGAATSRLMLLSGDMNRETVQKLGESMANTLIERVHIKSKEEYLGQNGMDVIFPQVKLGAVPPVDIVDILSMDDQELVKTGKEGIANADGTRRGPLALDLSYMKAIVDHFRAKGRNPRDIELETLAQTWSEHCKHTIFADSIDDIKDGLYKHYIKRATQTIRKLKGKDDFCISVFTDNSGAIGFDDRYLITYKAETHNSPSALDPFGGSITGIVGVYRDAIGFGLGAKPIFGIYGFCFGYPWDKKALLQKRNGQLQAMLSPRRIMDGVIDGVNVGGNCSGIPTPQGFVHFDERYKGKPLVFVGVGGLITRTSAGRDSCAKAALVGDYIVMAGGRVGKDGIHGATFSSEALDSGSPATAVQIGDPITQKKLSDAVIKEARDRGLYNSITDNGAGGLASSVGEMCKESGGAEVELDKVPLKYAGLRKDEIWISEAQERMTLAVPKAKWKEFNELMESRGVEATVIGEFTDSGKCVAKYDGEVVMDLDMDFLHDGLPPRPLETKPVLHQHDEPGITLSDLTTSLHSMLARPNIASFEFISQQYDHEVQAGSVLKPLQGRGRVNADATALKPVLDSPKAVILSQGINPSYSDIDTYHMAACAIDTAIRNAICAGAKLEKIALMDNFCWCSSNDPERLWQLRKSAEACFDYSVAYQTPFISGKDSMFNDFKGFDEQGNPIKVSIPPTLMISTISVIDDATKIVSLDAKVAGDIVYVLGDTEDELGGSELYAMMGEETRGTKYIGNNCPKVDAKKNAALYVSLQNAIEQRLVASAQSVHKGGIVVALAKTAMGGRLGMDIEIPTHMTWDNLSDQAFLYSESQGRAVVTVAAQNKERFEAAMKGTSCNAIGHTRQNPRFRIAGEDGRCMIDTDVDLMLTQYKSTFKDY